MDPLNRINVFQFLGYKNYEDFFITIDGDLVLVEWFHQDPEPTDQQIIDAGNSPEFAIWLEEHGGDALKTQRRKAKEYIDDANQYQAQVLRAFMLLMIDELNILRAQHGLADRTPLQLRNAIKNKIADGDADG